MTQNGSVKMTFPEAVQPNRRQAIQGTVAAVLAASPLTENATAESPIKQISDIAARGITKPSVIKSQAAEDYAQSLQAFQGRLSTPITQLLRPCPTGKPWDYDVVVIGSGYGSSICAARLAPKLRPGSKICILERGKEWVPGSFPDVFRDIAPEARRSLLGLDKRTIRNPTGLINLIQGDDISVLTGCALGGTSVINANVAIRPDAEVFRLPCWPTLLRDRSFLDPYFDRAEWELGVQREPIDSTRKMQAQRFIAEKLRDCGAHFEASALTITRGPIGLPIVNRQGMIQRPCTNCGDCMTGCNVGAKNTLTMNYLPLARRAGTDIFTETEVQRIEKVGNHYQLHYTHYAQQGNGWVPVQGCLKARLVIVGAGSLGSSELMMRSQSDCFQFSGRLGCSWSSNGDILGVIRNTCPPTDIGGFGAYDPEGRNAGPSIQSNITFPGRPNLFERIVVQDGVSPRAYSNFMTLFGRDLGLDHTQVLLVSAHDGAEGRLALEADGSVRVVWPGLYHHPYRRVAEAEFHRFASVLGGSYKEMLAFKGRVGTVHPLGGCSLGEHPGLGVVNHKGQVFDGLQGGYAQADGQPAVHQGLYVVDGAIVPTSLAANPLITISALAERIAEYIPLEPAFADLFQL